MRASAFIATVVLAAGAARADIVPVLWAGHVEDNGSPIDGPAFVALLATNESGATAVDFEDSDVVVVAGDFVLELLVDDAVVGPLTASITINGQVFDDEELATAWSAAAYADVAIDSDDANDVDAIGGVDDPVGAVALASGGVPVDVAHVVDFPADFLDGDDGLALSATARIGIVDGVIAINDNSIIARQLTGVFSTNIADNAVTTAKLDDDGLTSSDFNLSIPLSAIAPASLRSINFTPLADRVQLFRVTNSACAEAVGQLVERSKCSASGGCPIGQVFTCAGTCSSIAGFPPPVTACDNTFAGDLVNQ